MNKHVAVTKILGELYRAEERFGKFQSAHEGHAVIREEFEEQWEAIKTIKWDGDEPDLTHVTEESIQLAAMTLRFIVDLLLCASLRSATDATVAAVTNAAMRAITTSMCVLDAVTPLTMVRLYATRATRALGTKRKNNCVTTKC